MTKQQEQVPGFRRRAIATLVCALGIMAAGAVLAPQAQAQIATTKHNLSSSGTGTVNWAGTDEICVFCHTPHGSDTTAAVPLWNRDLTNRGPYQTYDQLGTVTLDGVVAPIGSVSIACLSCHDGQTALNAVINAPGSGLAGQVTRWNPTAAWTGAGPGGVMPAGITNIGLDLRNDHPIGIQYAGGGYTATNPTGLNVRDSDFAAPQNATINGNLVWWVDSVGGTAGTRQKSDMILYTRTVATAANEPEPFVECASCHDPHVSANPTFLRRNNVGSGLCLTCHTK